MDVCAGLVAALAVSLYSHKTLEKALESLVPLIVGIAVAALARLALSSTKKEATAAPSSSSSSSAAAEARHAVVLARMKRDQEALMAAVARLEALTSGAEGGGDNAEGRRRR